jgi:membrane protease YdiL (CAAX protease family)
VQLILIQALMDIAWVAFILFLIRGLHGRPSLRVLHFLPVGKPSVGRLIAGGAFLALAVLGASIVLPRPAESPLEKLLATTPSLILFVFFAIVVGPLLEEIVFRGFLFTALADVFGVRVAVPVTALLFAGLHGRQLGGNLPVLALILVVGYILTRVRERSNSIVPSIIMHTTYNATLFVVPGLASVLGFDPAP